MSTKIYTMTHKKFNPPSDDTYIPLHVGRACACTPGAGEMLCLYICASAKSGSDPCADDVLQSGYGRAAPLYAELSHGGAGAVVFGSSGFLL